jgi:hypothetical protein
VLLKGTVIRLSERNLESDRREAWRIRDENKRRRFTSVFERAVIIAVATLGSMGISFIRRGFSDGFSGRAEPSAMEAFIAGRIRRMSMRRG